MKNLRRHIFVFLIFISFSAGAQPFADEIAGFKKQDSLHGEYYPGRHPIVFTGSSSFRMWKDIQEDFPGYPIINRGFGGSSFPDLIRYAEDIIFKYSPKQVVIYCGDNDLAASDSVTGKMVFTRFKKLFRMIRGRLPQASVVFVSIKPSPSRVKLLPQVREANDLIRKFLKRKPRTAYADVFSAMLDINGSIRQELFLPDNLHMKPEGYAIWQKTITPYLLK